MPTILAKEQLAPKITSFTVLIPRVARNAKPGHFVVLRLSPTGERIPLTIADYDAAAGTVRLVVQEIGKTTSELCRMEPGDEIMDFLGPLGTPVPIELYGRVACVCGGLGAAPIYPKAKALKAVGNQIISFMGAQTAEMLIMRDEFEAISDEMYYATNDGSFGHHGFVTTPLEEYLASGQKIDHAIAVGPVPMMKAVCEVTRRYGVHTTVSLNPVMVDGTGMCGGCRVTVNGEVKFSCIDGPAFDGHQVDFDELLARQRYYREQEQASIEAHKCRIGG